MPIRPETIARRHEYLFRIVRRLIAEKGYDGVTAHEVAGAAGIAVSTLYRRFGSREAMLSAAIEVLYSEAISRVRDSDEWFGFTRLIRAVHISLDFMETDPEYTRAVTFAVTSSKPAPVSERAARMYEGLLAKCIEEMIDSGMVVSPFVSPHEFARTLAHSSSSIYLYWARGSYDIAETRRLVDVTASLLVLGLCSSQTRRPVELLLERGHSPTLLHATSA